MREFTSPTRLLVVTKGAGGIPFGRADIEGRDIGGEVVADEAPRRAYDILWCDFRRASLTAHRW